LINTALNLALTELDQEQVWRELRSTLDVSVVSGDDHIDLPSSVGKVQEVRFINGQSSYTIPFRSKSWVAGQYPDPSSISAGKPVCCYLEGGVLQLIPAVDNSYTIRATVYNKPASLESDSSELVPAGWANAVVAWATAFIFRSIGDFEGANQWMGEYNRSLYKLKAQNRLTYVEVKGSPFEGESQQLQTKVPWLDPFNSGRDD
jgi:hypothetical protein